MGSLIRAGLNILIPKTPRQCLVSVLINKHLTGIVTRELHTSYFLNVKGQEIKMPSLSPTMSEGTIVKWLKKEGDPIKPGDVLCDIQTDKAVVSMETEEEGVLAKILVPEDTKDVKVGTLIALMVPDGEDWTQIELPADSSTIASTPTSPSIAASNTSNMALSSTQATLSTSSGPPVTIIAMPSLSPTMTEGTIVQWLKKEGDPVSPGDALCEIQTDKAVMTMDTEEEGILAKILKPDDSKNVSIGSVIALIVPEGEDWRAAVVPQQGVSASQPQPTSAAPPKTLSLENKGVTYGPAVRSLLDVYQIQASSISPTGRRNKLLKEDVLNYIKANSLIKKTPLAVPPPQPIKALKTVSSASAKPKIEVRKSDKARGAPKYTDIELTNVRKIIAKRLSESKQQIPHAYSVISCCMENLLKLRKELANSGVKVSVNDVIIKATAAALEQCPKINITFGPQGINSENVVDISVAVATDNGLITPIIRNANTRSLSDISGTVRELAGRAKAGKLKPDEFQGGTFTISNLGMFGVAEFSAIINPPQGAILAVGGSISRVSAVDHRITNEMRLTLSFDARAIAFDEAAQFLSVLQSFIEDPKLIITGITPEPVNTDDKVL